MAHRNRNRSLRLPPLAWAGLLTAFSGLSAMAQQAVIRPGTTRQKDGETSALGQVFQPAPSDVRKPLLRAQKAIAEGRHADAARELGALLMNDSPGDAENQDYFVVEVDDQQQTLTSLRAEARRLLASLPPAGREAYELQFGAQARALLDESLAAGDSDRLSDLIRRFPHTRAGYEAAMLAGRYEMARGWPMAAALCFQRLVDTPPAASQFEPELSVLLATCWLYAQMPDKAAAVLVALKQRLPQATLRFGDQEVRLFADNTDPLTWLRNGIGRTARTPAAAAVEWVLFRGNAQRSGRAHGGIPLISYRWRVPTPLDRADEKLIDQMTKQYRDEGRAALPALQPLAIGGTILMRTPEKLLGVDFRSGKRIWVWPPWDEAPADREAESVSGPRPRSGLNGREQELQQRIWDDAAYGQLASDGQSVFLLHELGYANVGNLSPHQVFIGVGGVQRAFPGAPRPYNLLVSLSLARQGAAQWVVGGEHGEDEPKLAGAFFLGVPLPLGEKLYVLAEFNGEIRLVVLQARNGSLDWQQQLAHTDAQTILQDGSRRLAGATPSYAEGVLVCPTSAGAVVAVDLATRSLLWGYNYVKQPAQPQNPNFGFNGVYPRLPKPVGQHWCDGTATVADGRVLLTPVEAEEVQCLDLLTGKPVWTAKREDLLYLACVHEGLAVFVGTKQVTALRLSDGKPAWKEPLVLSEPPSGRGFHSEQYYFLPTARGELLKLDLAKGEVAHRTATSLVLGNLVCYRDDVVSQGPDWLAAFSQIEPLRRHVDQVLAANPNDVQALTSRGELLLQEGKRAEAIAALEQAYRLAPQEDTVRTTLVEAMLTALRDDFATHRHYAEQIDRLLDRPAQRSEYLRLMAAGWQAAGQLEKAFDMYLQLARLKGNVLDNDGSWQSELEKIDRHWSIRLDRWLQARIGELLAAASPEQRAGLDRAIRAQFDVAMQNGDQAAWQRFLASFGAHPLADQVRLRLAASLIETGEWLQAELLLSRYEHLGDDGTQAAATAEMAWLLERTRQFDRAADYYRQLGARWGEVVCRDGKTGQQLCAAAAANRGLQEALTGLQAWPYGKVQVTENADQSERLANFRRVISCRMQQRSPASPRGLQAAYDQQRNALIIRDGWGQTLLNANLGVHRFSTPDFSLIQTRANGHLLLVSVGNEVLAINLFQTNRNRLEAILWRQDLVHAGAQPNILQMNVPVLPIQKHPWGGARQVFADPQQRLSGAMGPLLDSGVCYLSLRELICADPLTGERIWSRDNLPQGSDLFGDRELLFVVPPGSDTARVFSALDGRELGERKVDVLENRWATSGRHVLAWQQEKEGALLELRLYDAWTGNELWHEALLPGTRGELVDYDEVAVLEPTGRFVVRSLRDNRPRVQAQLEPEKIRSIFVLRSQEQYLLAANRAAVGAAGSSASEFQGTGQFAPLLIGNVYAFDRATGKPQWQVPASIESFGWPLDQPLESPFLVLLRNVRPTQPQPNNRMKTSLLCLDRRDGRIVLFRDDIPVQTNTFEIVADPREHAVNIALPSKSFMLKLTDEPMPPEPPAQTGLPPAATAPAAR